LSLQYHNVKDETIYLQSGKLLFEIEEAASCRSARCAGRARPHHAEDRARMTAIEEATSSSLDAGVHDVVRLEIGTEGKIETRTQNLEL
jgi:hypothetical protein